MCDARRRALQHSVCIAVNCARCHGCPDPSNGRRGGMGWLPCGCHAQHVDRHCAIERCMFAQNIIACLIVCDRGLQKSAATRREREQKQHATAVSQRHPPRQSLPSGMLLTQRLEVLLAGPHKLVHHRAVLPHLKRRHRIDRCLGSHLVELVDVHLEEAQPAVRARQLLKVGADLPAVEAVGVKLVSGGEGDDCLIRTMVHTRWHRNQRCMAFCRGARR